MLRRFTRQSSTRSNLSLPSTLGFAHSLNNAKRKKNTTQNPQSLQTVATYQKNQEAFYQKRLAYAALFLGCMFTIHATLPDQNNVAYLRLQREIDGKNIEAMMRWSFILCCTGLLATICMNESIHNTIQHSAERYMEKKFHTVFEENIDDQGLRRVFFRAVTIDHAKFCVNYNVSPLPWSLMDGRIGTLPTVIDVTLNGGEDPGGDTTSVISLSSNLGATAGFGVGSRTIMIVIPQHQRIASVAQHAIQEDDRGEYEYFTCGLKPNDILGYVTTDENGDYKEFVLNPKNTINLAEVRFTGQINELAQFMPPDLQERVKQRIDNNLDYDGKQEYDQTLAPNQAFHKDIIMPLRKQLIKQSVETGKPLKFGTTRSAILEEKTKFGM